MSNGARPEGYSSAQIALHWIVVVLIVCQLLFHEGMEHAWRAVRHGEAVPADAAWPANVHAVIGLAILFFALCRLVLRFTRGVPPLPREENVVIRIVARLSHWLLYALIIVMPISGAAAWLGGVEPAGDFHVLLVTVLYVVAGIHILGALFEGFVRRSGVLTRMFRPA